VAFDDGSEYAVRFDAIVSIEPDPEITEADGVLYLTDDGQRTALTAGVRVATSPRGWGTLAADAALAGYVAVLFDGADYPIPVAATSLLVAVQPEPTAASVPVDITITREPLASATPGGRSASCVYSYISPVRQELPRGKGDPYVIEVGQSIEYGTNLTALRDMLRRKFGKFSRTHLAWCS
jgi:hypothetical protein